MEVGVSMPRDARTDRLVALKENALNDNEKSFRENATRISPKDARLVAKGNQFERESRLGAGIGDSSEQHNNNISLGRLLIWESPNLTLLITRVMILRKPSKMSGR